MYMCMYALAYASMCALAYACACILRKFYSLTLYMCVCECVCIHKDILILPEMDDMAEVCARHVDSDTESFSWDGRGDLCCSVVGCSSDRS